ncbi:Hypothetical predicted protein [Pelobates cultripes]|uniref:Uncharacterized protein n=1 Tax=Pelobates cultripes TaxID=61616 RepID=A0AAD1RZY4_PELCU|nr:Hypothetical predicted protein [Pelobates cultripes]
MVIPSLPSVSPQWKLNDLLLNNTAVITRLQKTVHIYFRENDSPDTTPAMQWEAHKYVAKGELIRMASHLKRKREMDTRKLSQEIKILEEKHVRENTLLNYTALNRKLQEFTPQSF